MFILWLKGFCFVRYAKKESATWAKREKNGVEVTDHQFNYSSFPVKLFQNGN